MTVIAGFIEPPATVWIGGDRAAVSGSEVTVRRDPKVWRKGSFLLGCAGSFRAMQLLRYQVQPPRHPRGMPTREYLTTLWVQALRAVIREAKCEQRGQIEAQILIGYRGHLYFLDEDYQIGEGTARYAAIGLGAPYALGALAALELAEVAPADRLRIALRAAATFCAVVRGPFTIRSLRP